MLQERKPCPICRADSVRSRVEVPIGFSRCHRCHTAYWVNSWSPAQATEYYHGYHTSDTLQRDELTEHRYHVLLDQFQRLRAVGRLLDVGCGTGHFLTVAEARGWDVVGLEVSQSALEWLGRLKRERGLRFAVIGTELTRSALPPNHFDVVTLFEVIEHLDDPLATLREAYRVLVSGGLLYLTTPNYNSLSRHLLHSRWRVIAPEHRCLLNPLTLKSCLVDAEFRPLRMVTKNIDVPEILSKWGLRRQTQHPTRPDSSSQRLRHTVEAHATLRVLKSGVNAFLKGSRLGDTIEVLVQKPHAIPRPNGTS